ncbi:MAG: MFS transporter [Planctomycetota bacterium]|nr:MFS transporter [Planctomycetota bacterium]
MTSTPVQRTLDYATAASTARTGRIAVAIGAMIFLSMLPVTMLVAPLKELIADQFRAGPFWTHSFMSINMIGAVVASPLIAALSDRAGYRKRVAALALAVDAVCLASMSIMPTLGAILVVRFIEGAAHILALTSLMAIAGGWASEGKRGRMMGVVGACMMFGTACGTQLGGKVYHYLPGWTFILAGLGSIVTALGVMLFVPESPNASSGRSRLRARDAADFIRKNPRLLVPFAYSFIDRLCVGVVITTLVLFLAEVHGLEPGDRGMLLGLCFLLPFAALIYPAGRLVDRVGRVWPLAIGSIAFGLIFATYGLLPRSGLWLIMLASGIASAVMFAPNLALCADLATASNRGAAFAGFNAAGSLGFVMGPILGGAIFMMCNSVWPAPTAYKVTFMATGATEVLCALITLPWLLRLKRQGIVK